MTGSLGDGLLGDKTWKTNLYANNMNIEVYI